MQPRFTFADAAAWVPYLAALGVTHLHLSPVLEAVPGSTHGYDVVDHTRVRAELGGEEGLRELSRTAREHGLGLILDIVPNHMAVPAPEHLNGPLWAVLRDGPGSPYADWFDIDWAALGGKVLLPVLGEPLPDVLDELSVGRDKRAGGKVLRYYDHRFPLREGTERLPLPELLAAQHYRLAYWRDARTELNYRRFFTISDLIAVRVERPEVFAATHATVLRLLRDGVADGLRVDHPDGLADPAGYLRRLAESCDGRWTVVEKILQRDEPLPAGLGVRGHHRLRRAGPDRRGLHRPGGRRRSGGLLPGVHRRAGRPGRPLGADRAPRRVPGGDPGPGRRGVEAGGERPAGAAAAGRGAVRRGGAGAADASTAPGDDRPVRAEHREADPYAPPYATAVLEEALRELLVRVPVYRPYVRPGTPATDFDTMMLTRAAARAAEAAGRRLAGPLGLLRDLALGRPADGAAVPGPDADDFPVRFAQVASALHAKSVEDTAFYRYGPLLPLCEVGRDPGHPATTPGGVPRLLRPYPARPPRHRHGAVHPRHQAQRRPAAAAGGAVRAARRLAGVAGRPRRRLRAVGRPARTRPAHRVHRLPDRRRPRLLLPGPARPRRAQGRPRGGPAHHLDRAGRGVREGGRRVHRRGPLRDARPRRRATSPTAWRRTPTRTRSARPCSTSRCRACPTSTRAPSSPCTPSSTRTTAARCPPPSPAPCASASTAPWPACSTARPRPAPTTSSCGSPPSRCACAGTTRSGTARRGRTSRCPRTARPPATAWPSCAAARPSRSSPACPAGWRTPAAGATRPWPSPRAAGTTCSAAARTRAASRCGTC